jgi:hypothetical protein
LIATIGDPILAKEGQEQIFN